MCVGAASRHSVQRCHYFPALTGSVPWRVGVGLCWPLKTPARSHRQLRPPLALVLSWRIQLRGFFVDPHHSAHQFFVVIVLVVLADVTRINHETVFVLRVAALALPAKLRFDLCFARRLKAKPSSPTSAPNNGYFFSWQHVGLLVKHQNHLIQPPLETLVVTRFRAKNRCFRHHLTRRL